jgi:hypothetical protein
MIFEKNVVGPSLRVSSQLPYSGLAREMDRSPFSFAVAPPTLNQLLIPPFDVLVVVLQRCNTAVPF